MNAKFRYTFMIIPLLLLLAGLQPCNAGLFVQCPGDIDGDLIPDEFLADGVTPNPDYNPNAKCLHVTGSDGWVKMADGSDMYIFSFGEADHTAPGFDVNNVVAAQTLKARTPAPILKLNEGEELYLTMSNVGMVERPDLFDTHSIHWHGFPNAAPIFDGLPEPSPTANMGASFTYYYTAAVPGTYFYHCHVEASEHMQMGMIGNTWIYPAQNGTPFLHDGRTFTQFAYNDGDGSTGYDVEYPFQLTAFDSAFHAAHIAVQALPFANMFDDYPMINGRGYPATMNPNDILNVNGFNAQLGQEDGTIYSGGITATAGERILLRVSNVSTTHIYTIATTMGVPMKVVGRGAALLRGPTGLDTSFQVNVLNVGGGQAYDVLIDTQGVTPGTYLVYTTNLANLSNGAEERGGIMTEITVN